MERIDTEILVAGGGVAGLAAAAAFAREGFDVVCVDAEPPVVDAGHERSDLRSTALLAPSVAFLERSGLWPRLAPHAAPLRVMRIADAGGEAPTIRASADFVATEIGAELFGYNLPNWLMRREMVAHLAELPNARLVAPARLAGLTPRTAGAVARLAGGTQARARLVVAADGRDSFVREAAGIGVRRWAYGQKALVFAVEHDLPHEGVSIEIHRSGGPFTLVPLPDGDAGPRSAVVWMETGPRAEALFALDPAPFEVALNARACGVFGSLRLASPRRLWPIVAQMADRLDGPRVALVAEAAHVMPPIGAQGLNTSLADVAALLDLVVAARAAGADVGAPELLGRLHRARHPEALVRVLGVDALNRAAMAGWPPFRDARLAALKLLHGVPAVRRTAIRVGLGVGSRRPEPAQ
jgi:2-octaprenyl-6-methoxyphenol hydroxylase